MVVARVQGTLSVCIIAPAAAGTSTRVIVEDASRYRQRANAISPCEGDPIELALPKSDVHITVFDF